MQLTQRSTIERQIAAPVVSADEAALVGRALRDLVAGRSIEQVEREMLNQPQAPAPVIHRFGPGLYIRELSLKAGTTAIGHYQRFEHLNVLLKGRVTVLNDNGTTTEFVAPAVFVGKPGRKVGYIHEDMVWQNIYATEETDIEKLEAKYLDKSDVWNSEQSNKRIAISHDADRADYLQMLQDVGVTHDVARMESENTADQIPMPMGSYKMMVSSSEIDGLGIFATAEIEKDELIAPARLESKRTPVGRYTNHSSRPNAKMVGLENGDIWLVATQAIAGCRGGQKGEEITIDYRQATALRRGMT